jgi:hypothetical protein
VSPEVMEAALARGKSNPTLAAIVKFVEGMCAVTVAESTEFWTANTVNYHRDRHTATFVIEMEKASLPSED